MRGFDAFAGEGHALVRKEGDRGREIVVEHQTYPVDLSERTDLFALADVAGGGLSFESFVQQLGSIEAALTLADVAASPVDGIVGQSGGIRGGDLLQAKGRIYSAASLLEDPKLKGKQ